MTSEMLDGGSSRAFSSPGRWLIGLGIAWIAVFLFFLAFPGADTGFSSIFCSRPDLAEGPCSFFPARNHWLTEIVRPVFYWIPVAALLVMLADIVWQYSRNRWADAARFRNEVLAIAAYLVGTLLVVNGLLKAYSGRPRPLDIPLFGGELSFMPVGDFSGACMSNCSFVSGEGAAAGWLLCLLPLLRGPWRNPIAALLIFVSLAAPLLRVVMGAHFLSDAILGWLIGVMTMPALVLLLKLIPKGISATLDRLR
ncbi:phosphatase PAP2 family protein [Rhizobium sp.]